MLGFVEVRPLGRLTDGVGDNALLSPAFDNTAGYPLWVWRDAIFSKEECQRITELADNLAMERGKLVGGEKHSNIRRCDLFWIDEEDQGGWIFERIMKTVADVNRDVFDFVLTDFAEKIQLTRYPEGQEGFYDWHVDRGSRGTAQHRKLTMVVQLSNPDTYEGGSLILNGAGVEETAPVPQGGAVFFPAYVLHRVSPVLKGSRYSLVTWVHGPNFR